MLKLAASLHTTTVLTTADELQRIASASCDTTRKHTQHWSTRSYPSASALRTNYQLTNPEQEMSRCPSPPHHKFQLKRGGESGCRLRILCFLSQNDKGQSAFCLRAWTVTSRDVVVTHVH